VISGTAVAAIAGVSTTGGSTRSMASVGIKLSFGRGNTGSGGARRVGRLANSSCAVRNRAAAPSPKIRTDIERMTAANRKRKPGSMGARIHPVVSGRAKCAKGNAVTTVGPTSPAANQSDSSLSQRLDAFCYKFGA
jgi:hypothetical protein